MHSGIVRMKAIARSYVWWPSIDQHIENIAKSCKNCLFNSVNPNKSLLHVWPWPDSPNIRLYADFLEFSKRDVHLIIIDAYSKWVDIREMRDITAKSTIAVFKSILRPGVYQNRSLQIMIQGSLLVNSENF